ncbi:MAG: hypothetical protein QNJ19_09760 [Woeseiaceae bacterium]|nr:hypothetical protein [Woeseiaceae bacterium]
MTYSSANRGFPAGNPIANAIVIIVGTLAIAASIIIGFVAFLVLASIILIMAAVVGLRLWWFNRKHRRQPRRDANHRDGVIEGEFTVIAGEEKDPR